VSPGPRYWMAALGCASATAVTIGVPTVLIPNPLFARPVPSRPVDYAVWLASAVLVGLLAATYLPWATGLRSAVGTPPSGGRVTAGGVLSFFAVGCPTCNKLVVLLLGSSGALSIFAPLQPLIGTVSLALLGVTLWTRLRALALFGAACPIGVTSHPDAAQA
jgi:hypothetical protein